MSEGWLLEHYNIRGKLSMKSTWSRLAPGSLSKCKYRNKVISWGFWKGSGTCQSSAWSFLDVQFDFGCAHRKYYTRGSV